MFKFLLLIALVAHYSTAKSIDLLNPSSEEQRDSEETVPDLSEVIREVENVQENFLRNLAEEMKKIDQKLQKIRDRHEEELEKSRRPSETRKPIKMTLEVSIPGREKEVKTFSLVATGEDGKPKIDELTNVTTESPSESDESEENKEFREGKELDHELNEPESTEMPEKREPEKSQHESEMRQGKEFETESRTTTTTPAPSVTTEKEKEPKTEEHRPQEVEPEKREGKELEKESTSTTTRAPETRTTTTTSAPETRTTTTTRAPETRTTTTTPTTSTTTEKKEHTPEEVEPEKREGKKLEKESKPTTQTPPVTTEKEGNESEDPRPLEINIKLQTPSKSTENNVRREPEERRKPDDSESFEHKSEESESNERHKKTKMDKGENSSSSSQESSEENRDLLTAPSGSNIVITLPDEAKRSEETKVEVFPNENRENELQQPNESSTQVSTGETNQQPSVPSSQTIGMSPNTPIGPDIIISLPTGTEQERGELVIGIEIPKVSDTGEKKNQTGNDTTIPRPTATTRRPSDGKRRPSARRCPDGLQYNIYTQGCSSPAYGTGRMSYYWYVSQSSNQNNPFMNMFGKYK